MFCIETVNEYTNLKRNEPNESADAAQFPLEGQISNQSNKKETHQQRHNGTHESTLFHFELLENFNRESEMTVRLTTLQLRPTETVNSN